jgi:hypothetical protein
MRACPIPLKTYMMIWLIVNRIYVNESLLKNDNKNSGKSNKTKLKIIYEYAFTNCHNYCLEEILKITNE